MAAYTVNLATVGKRIRYLRATLDMNQVELTRELRKRGVSITNQYISELERTEKTPSGEVIAGLAQVLGTTSDFLLMLTDDALPPGEDTVRQDGIQVEDQHGNRIVYEVPSEATRQLAQRLLTVFSELTDAERAYVVSIADQLRTLNHPRIIGDDTTTEGRTTEG